MVRRSSFFAAVAACAAVPGIAAAKQQPKRSPGTHVHGANGVVRLPEGRPLEWESEVLDGPRFRLSAYRGRVVFINIFATWCPPCNSEQPDLVAFALAHPDDTAVIGMDDRELDNTVRKYRARYDIPYPIAMDRSGRTIRGLFSEIAGLPMTLVIRPDGTLSCAWTDDKDRAWFEAERLAALEPPAAP
jgi:thiol-disulfide isomerase/thioredoxin